MGQLLKFNALLALVCGLAAVVTQRGLCSAHMFRAERSGVGPLLDNDEEEEEVYEDMPRAVTRDACSDRLWGRCDSLVRFPGFCDTKWMLCRLSCDKCDQDINIPPAAVYIERGTEGPTSG